MITRFGAGFTVLGIFREFVEAIGYPPRVQNKYSRTKRRPESSPAFSIK
jgi:DNA-binding Lrp family transcriptional regulator